MQIRQLWSGKVPRLTKPVDPDRPRLSLARDLIEKGIRFKTLMHWGLLHECVNITCKDYAVQKTFLHQRIQFESFFYASILHVKMMLYSTLPWIEGFDLNPVSIRSSRLAVPLLVAFSEVHFRPKREQLQSLEGPLPENQGQNLALTVSCVPSSLDRGAHQML